MNTQNIENALNELNNDTLAAIYQNVNGYDGEFSECVTYDLDGLLDRSDLVGVSYGFGRCAVTVFRVGCRWIDRILARVVTVRRGTFPALFYSQTKPRPCWALILCPETCLISHVRRGSG